MNKRRSGHFGCHRTPRRAAGFTLVELLVTMVVIAIVTGAAIPVFRDFTIRRAIAAQVSDFSGMVRLARSEALKRGRTVTLCRTADSSAAAPTCTDGPDWSSGWLIHQGGTVIRVQPGYSNSGGIEASSGSSIDFLSNGVARGVNGSFTFRPKVATSDPAWTELTRQLCISASGVTRPC